MQKSCSSHRFCYLGASQNRRSLRDLCIPPPLPHMQHRRVQELRQPFQVSSSANNSMVARMSEKLQNTLALVAPLITAAETMGKPKKTK